MSAINNLLGIDPNIERPNAYQIFGLEVLESDASKIDAAMRAVVQRLNASRETADPKAWSSAAKSVKKAKEILSDPIKKAKYDERLKTTFDSVAVSSGSGSDIGVKSASPAMATVSAGSPPPPPPPVDLLAGLLPTADPFAAFDMAVALAEMPQEVEETEPLDDLIPVPASPFAEQAVGSATAPAMLMNDESEGLIAPAKQPVIKTPKKRRRKSFPVAGAVMVVFVIGLLGGIGYAVKVLMDKEQALIAAAERQKEEEPKPASTRVVLEDRKPRDNVMGNLLPKTKRKGRSDIEMGVKPKVDSMINRDRENEQFADVMPNNNSMAGGDMMEMQTPDGNTEPMQPDGAFNTGQITEQMTTTEVVEMDNPPPTDAMIAKADAAAKAARDAIKAYDWKLASSLSDKAIEEAVTDDQTAQAQARKRLVHYASEYQAAIDRQLAQYDGGGENLQLTEDVVVGVVEVNAKQLILKVSGRNRTYEIAKLPPVVAHALGRAGLRASEPVRIAFKGAWDCLREGSTQAHRDQAYIEWLQIAGQSEDADIEGLQQEVEAIFSGE